MSKATANKIQALPKDFSLMLMIYSKQSQFLSQVNELGVFFLSL